MFARENKFELHYCNRVKVMQSIARIIDKVKSKQDDDFIDRANYVYTALMFGTFGLITAAKQYVGEPLQCWIPADFKVITIHCEYNYSVKYS